MLLSLMVESKLDYTIFWRELSYSIVLNDFNQIYDKIKKSF